MSGSPEVSARSTSASLTPVSVRVRTVTDRIRVTTFDAKQSYWLQRGWAQQAPIKTQSRIDRPRSGASVPAGQL
ncbi:MAG: hypothetical protein QOI68_2680, partial [Pseudonocardiales bacterium]|nr:hypothetical protein [Pseudonocardiales bacterium]